MPAYKDEKTGKWYVNFKYKDADGVIHGTSKRGFPTRKEALIYESSFKTIKEDPMSMKFANFVDLYMDSTFEKLSQTTRDTKYYMLNDKVIPYFGKKRMKDITTEDVIQWQNVLSEGNTATGKKYSQSYIKAVYDQLNAIFNFAMKNYGLQRNPAYIAGTLTGNRGSDDEIEVNFWSLEEYIDFLVIVDDENYALLFQILYWLGIHEGEALALKVSDFNFDDRTVYVSKTRQETRNAKEIKPIKNPRTITIPKFLCDELKEYCNRFRNSSTLIFDGLNKSTANRVLQRGAGIAKLTPIKVKDLRHSHVYLLIKTGFNTAAIAERIGQRSEFVAKHYGHLYETSQKDVANALQKTWLKNQKHLEKAVEQAKGFTEGELQTNFISLEKQVIFSLGARKRECTEDESEWIRELVKKGYTDKQIIDACEKTYLKMPTQAMWRKMHYVEIYLQANGEG